MEREIRPDGIERFNNWVRRAAAQGRSEIEIMRFPSQYCTDHGRAINNLEEGWPETLTGAGAGCTKPMSSTCRRRATRSGRRS